MISLVIPHVPTPELDPMLDKCLSTLKGYDELVVVINDGIGYGAAFNRCFKYAKGDFIIAVSNDTELTDGELKDLCDPEAFTYSSNAQPFCFFCLPRWVYEKVGGFDEKFGLAYFEDDDYLLRLKVAGVPIRQIENIKVNHIGGATVKALNKEREASQHGRDIFVEKYGAMPDEINRFFNEFGRLPK